MYRVRWFETDGTVCTTEPMDRETALTYARVTADELGLRHLVMQRIRGRWHVAFDSAIGY